MSDDVRKPDSCKDCGSARIALEYRWRDHRGVCIWTCVDCGWPQPKTPGERKGWVRMKKVGDHEVQT